VFRCTECGHGDGLRAWAHVNIHGDLGPDGHIDWPDCEDDAFWLCVPRMSSTALSCRAALSAVQP
jgi:hypothetical protein